VCVRVSVCAYKINHTVKYIISHYDNTFILFTSSKQDGTFVIKNGLLYKI